MPKPRLGSAAKTQVLTVRVTQDEKDALTDRYGSPTKALRALIASVVTREER